MNTFDLPQWADALLYEINALHWCLYRAVLVSGALTEAAPCHTFCEGLLYPSVIPPQNVGYCPSKCSVISLAKVPS